MSENKKSAHSAKGMGPMGHGAHFVGSKAKDFKGTLKKMMKYMGKYKISIFIVCLFAVASTVFLIFSPKIMGEATTIIFEGIMGQITGTGSGIDFTKIMQIIVFLLSLYVVSGLFSYLQGFIMAKVSMKVTYNLRRDIFAKINKLPLKYFDSTSYGDVLSRITNDIDSISQSLNQSITQIITSVASVIGIAIMMFTISWQITLVALCVLPVSLLLVLLIVQKSQKHFVQQQAFLGKVNGHIEEMYGNHVLIKSFNGEQDSIETFSKYNDKLYVSAWKSQFLSGTMMPAMDLVSNIGYVLVCVMGGAYAASGVMSVGGIQSFIQYVRQFTQPISQVGRISNVLQMMIAAAERVFNFLEEEEETPDKDRALDLSKIQGSVEFDHVHFGYSPDKIIINDFSARVEPGQKVAIVGPTGAGKTTMIKLLMRFYDLNAGSIKVDGVDITEYSRKDLRSMFGMVLQDTWLYNGTIADNIRYGRLDATDEEVKRAAKAAQVDHFVRTLPDGYDMVLNEEASNVSQGEKQLLTIARAVLADPKILILDEATSSVDTRTEVLIQKAMDYLMAGRTSFVIAHRLSTIRNADVILVMRDGDIVEQGNHEQLMAQNGFYANLYNSQFDRADEEPEENA